MTDYRYIKELIKEVVLEIANYTQEGREICPEGCTDLDSLQWSFIHGDKHYVNKEMEDKSFPIAVLDPMQWSFQNFVDNERLPKSWSISLAFFDSRNLDEDSETITRKIEKIDESVNEFLNRLNQREDIQLAQFNVQAFYYFDWNSYITCGQILTFTLLAKDQFDCTLLENNIEDLKCN